eukprot:TRINITY_DN3957_c0_g2_i1.p1 TRINITY_DN3957_c0_g2~~TRINITY_DN3957_c0_g2_i1.p1  ORF type:complete len:895 (+),score=176.94 TRINITY_DN3957_c0_g2_i1:131-2686(+)
MEVVTKLAEASEHRPLPVISNELKPHMSGQQKHALLSDEFDKIESLQQFYKWFGSLEQGDCGENEAYRSYLEQLRHHISNCKDLSQDIAQIEKYLQEIETQYHVVSKKTDELHHACEGLVLEEKRMNMVADSLQDFLSYFEDLDVAKRKLNDPEMTPQSPDFLPMLKRVDECIRFLQENPLFKESSVYLKEFWILESRCLKLIKAYIVAHLKEKTSSIMVEAKSTALSQPVVEDAEVIIQPNLTDWEVNLYYLQMKTFALKLRTFCSEMEERTANANRADYQELLSDCHYSYFQLRRVLLNETVSTTLTKLVKTQTLPVVIRTGSMYLINVCVMECDLYNYFFHTKSPGLRMLLEGFSTILYDNIRPIIIRCYDMDMLCSLVHILRNKITQDELEKKGELASAIRPIIAKIQSDIQERLIFISMNVLRMEVKEFVPTDDIFLVKKETYIKQKETKSVGSHQSEEGKGTETKSEERRDTEKGTKAKSETASDAGKEESGKEESRKEESRKEESRKEESRKEERGKEESGKEESRKEESRKEESRKEERGKEESGKEDLKEGGEEQYGKWFPPLKTTLVSLSKLYLCLDSDTFDGIAQEAMSYCLLSLKSATLLIQNKQGVHAGQLFLIQNLQILQQQIKSFDVSLMAHETSLDFSHLLIALRHVVSRQIFSLSRNNPIFQVVAQATPRIKTSEIDYKKDMETLLQTTTSDFYTSVHEKALLEMNTWLATASKFMSDKKRHAVEGQSQERKEFRELPIAEEKKIQETIDRTIQSMDQLLPAVFSDLKLFFPLSDPVSANTSETLFKTIKQSILESFQKIYSILHENSISYEGLRIPEISEISKKMDTMFYKSG